MSTGRPTQRMDHSLRQSVGAGMQSVFGKGGRTYYVLRHLSNSSLHRAGEEQPIIIDYVEIGRDPKCQVRFDESQSTVSRRHAAIMKEGNNWVLRNLSVKNPTLINGRPVNKQWFLNPGDQIQLSMEGPKIGFVMPSNPSVNSIPLTQRLNLFRKQALLPYKRALMGLAVLFLLTISGLSAWLYRVNEDNLTLNSKLVVAVQDAKRVEGDVDSLRAEHIRVVQESAKLKSEMKRLQGRVSSSKKEMSAKFKEMQDMQKKQMDLARASGVVSSEEVAASFRPFYKDVYYIRATRLVAIMDGETETIDNYPLSGTGFLLSDGSFITARHIVEPWLYFDANEPDPLELVLNILINNGGEVYIEFEAYAQGGNTLTFSSKNFKRNNSRDESRTITNPESKKPVLVTHASFDDGMDWAVYRIGRTGSITTDTKISRSLPNGAELFILGFPFGMGTSQTIEPIQSSVKTASSNLENNVIVVNGSGIEPGNSGGPAFYFVDGQYKAVGVVSAKASSYGFLVPIGNIR